MTTGTFRFPDAGRLQELHLLDQVHTALGSASRLDDFYVIACSLLVDPNTFAFSRALFLRYDERNRTFGGKLAVGGESREEHEEFRRSLSGEEARLQEQMDAAQKSSPEPIAIQPLYDLRFHGLWIHLLQENEEGTNLNSRFHAIQLRRDNLPQNHLLEQASEQSSAKLYSEETADISGLESFVHLPLIAGRLMTKRGIHGILIADRAFETAPLNADSLLHFQWLLNHASVMLDNVELVSELRATTERLQEVDRMKTNFLSIVSHELRTPLTSIIGFVHLLSEGRVGETTQAQTDLLKRVAQHAAHLQHMVNDLLEIAEVEAGGIINATVQPVDPLAAVLRVIPKIEARRGNKQVSVEPIIEGPVPLLLGDPNALERILFHLVDNAVKFIPKNGRVWIEFKPHEHDLHVTVADTGIGIPKENLQRIFDHFYQVDFRLERAYGGMGIGLSVVKMLLDATGGRIQVESSEGIGSRFTVSYPLAKAANELSGATA